MDNYYLVRVYLITYDLNSPYQDYSKLIDSIKRVGDKGYVRVCKSSFLVRSTLQTAQEILKILSLGFDYDDDVFVAEIKANYGYYLNDKEQLQATVESLLSSIY